MIRKGLFRSNLLRIMSVIRNKPRNHTLPTTSKPQRLFFTTQLTLLSKEFMENIDVQLKNAAETGETAIMELMDMLKQNIVQISKTYKECLSKEIKITEQASREGPRSSKWDELPQYRILEAELSEQWNNFETSIIAVGEMIERESMKHVTKNSDHQKIMSKKFQELRSIIAKESTEIKELQAKLLEAKKRSIENSRKVK